MTPSPIPTTEPTNGSPCRKEAGGALGVARRIGSRVGEYAALGPQQGRGPLGSRLDGHAPWAQRPWGPPGSAVSQRRVSVRAVLSRVVAAMPGSPPAAITRAVEANRADSPSIPTCAGRCPASRQPRSSLRDCRPRKAPRRTPRRALGRTPEAKAYCLGRFPRPGFGPPIRGPMQRPGKGFQPRLVAPAPPRPHVAAVMEAATDSHAGAVGGCGSAVLSHWGVAVSGPWLLISGFQGFYCSTAIVLAWGLPPGKRSCPGRQAAWACVMHASPVVTSTENRFLSFLCVLRRRSPARRKLPTPALLALARNRPLALSLGPSGRHRFLGRSAIALPTISPGVGS